MIFKKCVIFLMAFSLTLPACSKQPKIPEVSKARPHQETSKKEVVTIKYPATAKMVRDLFGALNRKGNLDSLKPLVASDQGAEAIANIFNLTFGNPASQGSTIKLIKSTNPQELELSLRFLAAFFASPNLQDASPLLRSLLAEDRLLLTLLEEVLSSDAMQVLGPQLADALFSDPTGVEDLFVTLGTFLTEPLGTYQSGASYIVHTMQDLGKINFQREEDTEKLWEAYYQAFSKGALEDLLVAFRELRPEQRETLREAFVTLLKERSLTLFAIPGRDKTYAHQEIEEEHPQNDLASLVKFAVALNRPLDGFHKSIRNFLNSIRQFLNDRLPPDGPGYRAIERYALVADATFQQISSEEFRKLPVEEKLKRYVDEDYSSDELVPLKNIRTGYLAGHSIFFEKSLETSPDFEQAFNTCVALYLGRGMNRERSREHCRRTVKRQPFFREKIENFTKLTLPALEKELVVELRERSRKIFDLFGERYPFYNVYRHFEQSPSLVRSFWGDLALLRGFGEGRERFPTQKALDSYIEEFLFRGASKLLQFNKPLDEFLRDQYDTKLLENSHGETWLRYTILIIPREEARQNPNDLLRQRDAFLFLTFLESYQALENLLKRETHFRTLLSFLSNLSDTFGRRGSLPHLAEGLSLFHSGTLHVDDRRTTDFNEWRNERLERIHLLSPFLKQSMSDPLGGKIFDLLSSLGSRQTAHALNLLGTELLRKRQGERRLMLFWTKLKDLAVQHPDLAERSLLALGGFLKNGDLYPFLQTTRTFLRSLVQTYPHVVWWRVGAESAKNGLLRHSAILLSTLLEREEEWRRGTKELSRLLGEGDVLQLVGFFMEMVQASRIENR